MKFNFKKNFSECIGNTPIIKLKVASELSGCEIYGKCEFLNPGGSVKDRPALQIIKDAIKKKQIEKGGTIVEGTAGNTGIGLCLVGNSIGLNENLDPRAAAEEIGYTFLPSVLIGLSNAPDIVELPAKNESISLHPDQIESIVVPNGALGGEAVLAGIEKGLNIISVKNQNTLNVTNEFYDYPNLFEVDNYLEAAGVIIAIKKGINLDSVKRPLKKIQECSYSD